MVALRIFKNYLNERARVSIVSIDVRDSVIDMDC